MFKALIKKAQLFANDEAGATAVEYGIMVALISAVIIGTVTILGSKMQAAFQAIVSGLG
ncbi:MAG: Flp family type IVb pilin [Candidatus Aquicultor sp.]|nr:Flp family type IVb pilin [Candidatus Aquicultor sp.]